MEAPRYIYGKIEPISPTQLWKISPNESGVLGYEFESALQDFEDFFEGFNGFDETFYPLGDFLGDKTLEHFSKVFS